MRIAVLVDSLRNKGGVQRIVLSMAKHLDADVFTGRSSPETTFEEFKSLPVKVLVKKPLPQRLGSLYLRHKFKQLRLDYDLYIFHGGASLCAAKNHKPNLWYCHSPTRYLYDLYEEEKRQKKGLQKILFVLITKYLRHIDQKNIKHIDKIFVNSENIQKRVKKYYNRESKVLYPFVDIEKFRWISQEDFYLSTARLDPIKRVDLLVKAFQKMPNKKLIIASSGPEYDKIMGMAKKCKNITVLGWVSDEKLRELYGKCIATFSVSYKEDFGIIPIESNACGKPCIATKGGGHLETIVHDKTGYLIYPENINNIINAVNLLAPKKAKSMRKACENRAKLFSEEKFLRKFRKVIINMTDSES